MTDEEKILLESYMIGFKAELKGISAPTILPKHLATTKAYFLGRHHALVGDDVSSIDSLSDDQIIEIINNL